MGLGTWERGELLRLARDAVAAAAKGVRLRIDHPRSRKLLQPAGAFVTLHRAGELRGCIGSFESSEPLYRTIAEMARSAAVGDPRFQPVRPEELAEIDLEISVLSPLRQVHRAEEVEVGRHGLYLVRGAHRGVLLPQVAQEYGWDRETFLDQTCRKAGLPPGSWREGTALYVFEAEVFGDEPRCG